MALVAAGVPTDDCDETTFDVSELAAKVAALETAFEILGMTEEAANALAARLTT